MNAYSFSANISWVLGALYHFNLPGKRGRLEEESFGELVIFHVEDG